MKRFLKWQVLMAVWVVMIVSVIFFGPVVNAGCGDKCGAELWSNNCRHCHNYRPPSSLSSDQWEVALTHMRFRCSLTAKEARKIVEFLKNAH